MRSVVHPPLEHFLSGLREERVWAQVLVRRQGDGFELRHVADRAVPIERLRSVQVGELRALARETAGGEFRPLRAAPNLVSGWCCAPRDGRQLAEALEHLYPGSLADWWASVTGAARAADLREVLARQWGRRRAIQKLRGEVLAAVVNAGCAPGVCLKHRRWTAPEVPPEDAFAKSSIPCMEPCALFLSFARACAAIEDSPSVPVALAPADLATLAEALRHALEHPRPGVRDGELDAPLHPRRLLRVLERHASIWAQAAVDRAESDTDARST